MTDPTSPAEAESWLELTVEVDHEAVEPVTELFARYGYNEGVIIQEPFTQEPDGDNLAVDPTRPVKVSTFVAAADVAPGTISEIQQALWHLGQMRSVGELAVVEHQSQDWLNAWKEHYHPLRVGTRVTVRPPWHDYLPTEDEVVVILDPGMAFGTGMHPSTKLAVLGLEEELRPGIRVLDVGTGSGVLAIAAVLLGAEAVDAVDIEPVAVRSTMENAERNGVADRIQAEAGSVGDDTPFTGPYPLVVANIIARVLIELSVGLAATVAPGGALVLSGIIESREPAVRRAFEGEGLIFDRRSQIEDWVGMVFRRPE